LSPLIAALEDPHDEVVGNALLGLMVLEDKDTPLEPICRLVQSSRDEGVRRNAAQCLAVLVRAGDRAECVLASARGGLIDPEPGVRSQCSLILATLVDNSSVTALCDRLYDEVPLVAAAAARAVAYIGAESPTDKGTCGRALAKAYAETKGTMHVQMRRALVELAGSDHGNEPEEWVAWASRLP
jgi:HEAT repeat protein